MFEYGFHVGDWREMYQIRYLSRIDSFTYILFPFLSFLRLNRPTSLYFLRTKPIQNSFVFFLSSSFIFLTPPCFFFCFSYDDLSTRTLTFFVIGQQQMLKVFPL